VELVGFEFLLNEEINILGFHFLLNFLEILFLNYKQRHVVKEIFFFGGYYLMVRIYFANFIATLRKWARFSETAPGLFHHF